MSSVIQSLFVYSSVALLMSILGKISYERECVSRRLGKHPFFGGWDIIAALFIFAFISGVRWNVGVDHLAYLENYLSIQNTSQPIFEKEPGFEFITNVLAESDIHFSFYFGFLAFLQIFFIYRAFREERYLYPFLGAVIIFGPEYLSWMNGIRQMLAATIFVWALQFIQQRKLFHYFLTVFFASLFHKSSLILLILYFIPIRDYFSNRLFNFVLITLSLIVGSTNWGDSLEKLTPLLVQLDYENYASNLTNFTNAAAGSNIGPRRLSMILTMALTVWFYPSLKARFKSSLFLASFNYAFIGFLLYNLFANMHYVFIRPISYLTIFSLPTTSYLLVYLKEKSFSNNHINAWLLIFILTLIISFAYLPVSIIADNGLGNLDFSNYKFYWFYN